MPADDQKVRVLRPDGRYSRIPVSSLSQAIAGGYKLTGNAPGPPAAPKELRPEPDDLAHYPGKILDRVGQNFKAMGDMPGQMLRESREAYKRGPQTMRGAVTAIDDSAVGQIGGMAKGLYGVSAPGVAQRMGEGDKPENISGDVAMSLMPGGEEGMRAVERPARAASAAKASADLVKNPGKAGSLWGAMTRAKNMMDRVDVAAKDIPVNHQPAYEWAQKAMALEKHGFTVPKPIRDFVALVESRSKPGMDQAGSARAFVDRGGEMSPLTYQASRNFEQSLGAKIPWDQDPGGKMNGIMKKMRESLGQETATALKPYGLDAPYLRAKADFTKAFGAEGKWGPFGYFGGKLAGYGTGAVTGHPLVMGYAGGKAGRSLAGSLARSVVNAGGKE